METLLAYLNNDSKILNNDDFELFFQEIKENTTLFIESRVIFLEILRILLNDNNFQNISNKKNYFLCLILIIQNVLPYYTFIEALPIILIEFILISNKQKDFPRDVFNIVSCLQKTTPKIFLIFLDLLGENFFNYFYSIDFYILMLNDEIYSENKCIEKLYKLMIVNIQNLYIFDESIQSKILIILEKIVLKKEDFIFILSPTHYKSIITIAFEANSVEVFSNALEFFSILHDIEVKNHYNCDIIWENVFSIISLCQYKKKIFKYKKDSRAIQLLVNLFIINLNDFKKVLFDESDDEDIESICQFQLFLLNLFQNIREYIKAPLLTIIKSLLDYSLRKLILNYYDIIPFVIDCFGLELTIFPEFIIGLIQKVPTLDYKKLCLIFNENDILGQCNEYFPSMKYFEIFSSFMESKSI